MIVCVFESLYACSYTGLTLRVTGSPANGKTHGIPEMVQGSYWPYKVARIKILLGVVVVVVVATNRFEALISR
jgi:hypothetical protein